MTGNEKPLNETKEKLIKDRTYMSNKIHELNCIIVKERKERAEAVKKLKFWIKVKRKNIDRAYKSRALKNSVVLAQLNEFEAEFDKIFGEFK